MDAVIRSAGDNGLYMVLLLRIIWRMLWNRNESAVEKLRGIFVHHACCAVDE